eukprot:CAMPEP_0171473608 /NCGR_PEP_ID=MMETSP0946-20130122/1941_1 /TAXON_ID=109269 /ORGANISM="Vaucheria litorea, Strain CCMP2940" /LENGTH=331 /DNA_ID=CAMNT_0012003401 /DNA_START=77 /DNA_END=1069 /DNA_ORIENTATION=+
MYNGIGLKTPRGSGTSGHVMSNKSSIRPDRTREQIKQNQLIESDFTDFRKPKKISTKANEDLLEHARRRKIEAKIFELQEAMIERGYNDDDIEAKVSNLRKEVELLSKGSSKGAFLTSEGENSHAIQAQKNIENERMREALLGSDYDYVEGQAFNAEVQERKKEERKAKKVEYEKNKQQREKKERIREKERERERKKRKQASYEEGEIASRYRKNQRRHSPKTYDDMFSKGEIQIVDEKNLTKIIEKETENVEQMGLKRSKSLLKNGVIKEAVQVAVQVVFQVVVQAVVQVAVQAVVQVAVQAVVQVALQVAVQAVVQVTVQTVVQVTVQA